MCRKARVETGGRVHVEMRRLGDTRPHELEELLRSDPRAVGERRDFLLFIADAKKPETQLNCQPSKACSAELIRNGCPAQQEMVDSQNLNIVREKILQPVELSVVLSALNCSLFTRVSKYYSLAAKGSANIRGIVSRNLGRLPMSNLESAHR
jgi:hypothetical protein